MSSYNVCKAPHSKESMSFSRNHVWPLKSYLVETLVNETSINREKGREKTECKFAMTIKPSMRQRHRHVSMCTEFPLKDALNSHHRPSRFMCNSNELWTIKCTMIFHLSGQRANMHFKRSRHCNTCVRNKCKFIFYSAKNERKMQRKIILELKTSVVFH